LIGKKVSHYSVTAKLGEGGMGEVYRATDTKLGRDVALKVLPEAFASDASDADRMARFEREAQVLASLNHPNIASIYGLEEADGVRCLVLELVEGPTLAERVEKGPVPLEEALPIARQMTEALEAAHERGVIHRDLKPGNVKVTPAGGPPGRHLGLRYRPLRDADRQAGVQRGNRLGNARGSDDEGHRLGSSSGRYAAAHPPTPAPLP
jgi:serine/threonine protein kinase